MLRAQNPVDAWRTVAATLCLKDAPDARAQRIALMVARRWHLHLAGVIAGLGHAEHPANTRQRVATELGINKGVLHRMSFAKYGETASRSSGE